MTAQLGLNDHPIWRRASQNVAWQLILDSGVKHLRIDVPWSVLEETGKGIYNSMRVSLIDDYMQSARDNGVEVLLVAAMCPGWANGGGSAITPPVNLDDYGDYVAWLAEQYPDAAGIEVWNEPNGGWAWADPDASRYAAMLKVANARIKAVAPNMKVLAPSLSGPDQKSWLTDFYASNPSADFDVFSMHGYWWNVWTGDGSRVPYWSDSAPDGSIYGSFLNHIYPIIVANGDADKPLWWTETGYSTSDDTEKAQAERLKDSMVHVSKVPNCERLYWYMAFDSVGAGAEPNFGVVDLTGDSTTLPEPTDFSPKAAFETIQSLTNNNQDNFVVSLSTDKTKYQAGEKVRVTVHVEGAQTARELQIGASVSVDGRSYFPTAIITVGEDTAIQVQSVASDGIDFTPTDDPLVWEGIAT